MDLSPNLQVDSRSGSSRDWLRRGDPRSQEEQLAALNKVRRLEGVTEQSKLEALERSRSSISFDTDALLGLCREYPVLRSAAFFGSVVSDRLPDGMPVRILVDLDETLVGKGDLLCLLAELDERFAEQFGQRADSVDYPGVEYWIQIDGSDHGAAASARVFYAQ